jgi:hypothetical protein
MNTSLIGVCRAVDGRGFQSASVRGDCEQFARFLPQGGGDFFEGLLLNVRLGAPLAQLARCEVRFDGAETNDPGCVRLHNRAS